MRLAVAVCMLAAMACAEPARLAHAHSSPEALGSAVLNAFARKDVEHLHALAVSEHEFRQQIWPGLPAARPERNVPVDYVWGDLRQKSDARLRALVAQRGGQRFSLVSLRFDGPVSRYATGTVRRNPTFVVRDTGGRVQELRLCGSILEKDGQWKVFSYIVDG